MGILLVYDVTDEQSFQNIRNWIRNIEQHGNHHQPPTNHHDNDHQWVYMDEIAADNVDKILVGNKCDMESEKVVETTRGQALAEEYSIKFFETSAKNNINVVESFEAIAKDIKKRLMDNPANATQNSNGSVPLGPGGGKAQGGKCCK